MTWRWGASLLVLWLATGCGDDSSPPDRDSGPADAGLAPDAGGGMDGGPGEPDAATPVDAGGGACVPYQESLAAGLSETIGMALAACGRGPCLSCALAGGTGASCGPGASMRRCILDCFEENDFGPCSMVGDCTEEQTCDTAAGICRNDRVTMLNEAQAAGDIDAPCTDCYAGITGCIVGGGCALTCTEAGCACDECQCEQACPAEFATCSGLDPYLDCAMVAMSCT